MVDSFLFLNELDLLEVRLNSLKPYVNKFVIAEANRTFTGIPKSLIFENNKDRFKDFNIEYLLIPESKLLNWEYDAYCRKFLLENISEGNPEEIILLSDLDEIPDLKNYKGEEGIFNLSLYAYYFNCFTGLTLRGVFAFKRKNINEGCWDVLLRKRYKKYSKVVGNGWHFTNVEPVEKIKYKIEASSHTELNTDEIKNKVEENVKNLNDLYINRKYRVEMPSGPEWLLENKERYRQLWK